MEFEGFHKELCQWNGLINPSQHKKSFGWTIQLQKVKGEIEEHVALYAGPVDGNPKDNSSFWAEPFGIASSILFVKYSFNTDPLTQSLRSQSGEVMQPRYHASIFSPIHSILIDPRQIEI
jgi:hypothetical protein